MQSPPDPDRRPALRSQWRVVARGAGAAQLMSELETQFHFGAAFEHLLPLLDGSRRWRDIVRELPPTVSEDAALAALESLDSSGMLREGAVERPREDAYRELLSSGHLGPGPASGAGLRAAVTILGAEPVPALEGALAALGICCDPNAPFRIVIAADYLDPEVDAINRAALESGRPWMLARPYGRTHWVGPLFVPGRTACWECLARRLRENGWRAAAASFAHIPAAYAATCGLVAIQAARWLSTGRNPSIEGVIRAFDTGALSVTRHMVARRPQCLACGGLCPAPVNRPSMPLDRHLSPFTGIVSRTVRVANGPALYAYGAEGSQVVRLDGEGRWLYAPRSLFAGRGSTRRAARARCFGEAVERYSIQLHGDEPRIPATRRDLGDAAVDPGKLLLFSERQYQAANAGGVGTLEQSSIPPDLEPFDDQARMEWVAARSLLSRRIYYVPAAYCYLGYGLSSCGADSNGCAAGRSLDAATARAFAELVERDAAAIWWYNRARRPGIDLGSFSSRGTVRLLRELRRRRFEVHGLDLTTDLGMPAVAAVVFDRRRQTAFIGCGASMSAAAAVWRALSDAALSALYGGRPHVGGDPLPDFLEAAPGPRRGAADYASPPTGSAATLRALLECAERAGVDVLRIDMTRPETALPVARVIAPGLRPWTPRFAPGRLYDVPVELGWREVALSESEMNPLAFPR